MAAIMKSFAISVLLLSLLLGHGAHSQCSDILTEEEVDDFVTIAIMGMLSEGGGTIEVELGEWNVNCLSAAPTGGYQMATVTVSYNVSGSALDSPLINQVAQLFLRCDTSVPLNPSWAQNARTTLLLSTSGAFAGGGKATVEELLTEEADRNCLACDPFAAPNSPTFCTRKCILHICIYADIIQEHKIYKYFTLQ